MPSADQVRFNKAVSQQVKAVGPGVLKLGELLAIVSLGDKRYVVLYKVIPGTTSETTASLVASLKKALGSDNILLLAGSQDLPVLTFEPLAESADFREMVGGMVKEMVPGMIAQFRKSVDEILGGL